MFKIIKSTRTGLRQGVVSTAHGSFRTPVFMPDATRGYLKLLTGQEVKQTGTEVIVVNTLHLYLQPGLKTIIRAGGLHRFMNWSGPILSDSGGYQILSLIHKNKARGKITDDQVIFKSPLDGSQQELTPEKSIQIQFALGADMMVCLDDCPPNDFARKDLEKAVERTIAWAKRCQAEYQRQIKKRKLTGRYRPLLFAVIQGGAEIDLREYCARELIKIGFDGYGFGARPVDAQGQFLQDVLKKTADFIPTKALRFALGIGTPADIRRCALWGWDMFDCVIPTREGRHGRLFLSQSGAKRSTLNINNACFATDFTAINKNSQIKELRDYSKAYLHHLFKMKESLGQKLASQNNLEFYQHFVRNLREKK